VGATSCLEVLTSQTNYFSAQLDLARAQLAERLSLVQVYNALGGGLGTVAAYGRFSRERL
jgi:multidrug efflux system outer membrane protein